MANAQEDGGGADLTANLTITGLDGTGNIFFGVEAAEYGLKNTGTADLYVTKLQFRGKGIYSYQTADYIAEDAASQAIHGVIPLSISFIYEDDPTVAKSYGEVVLSETADEGTTVSSFSFNSSRNSMTMAACLQLEPGTRFTSKEDQAAIDGDFFVNGYSAVIQEGKYVEMTIIPRVSGVETYWILGVSALGIDTALGIG